MSALDPDPATLRAVEKAARMACYGGMSGDRCDQCTWPNQCRHHADWLPGTIAAIATFLREMGQDLAAARVERCAGQPAPTDDAAFLAEILTRARAGERASREEIARLKRLADWADAAPAPGWDGTMDPAEVERAVVDARGRMQCPT